MIKYVKKDITSVKKGVVAHGCNCQGTMGSGVALAIKKKWPKAYENYALLCRTYKNSSALLGKFLLINVWPEKLNTLFVANLFTQNRYGNDGKRYASPEAIMSSLHDAVSFANGAELPLYMPRIGCGLGGLTWDEDVLPIVEKLAKQYPDTTIYVCDL